MTSRKRRALGWALGIVPVAVVLIEAGGISIPYGEIRVGRLLPGRVYVGSRDILQGKFYSVGNSTDGPLDYTVDVSSPAPGRVVPGYEPIPDPSWVTLSKPYFSSEAGQSGLTDFYISIPAGKAHLGKSYQVQLTARTMGKGFLQMALGGRALITVSDAETDWAPGEKKFSQMAVRLRPDPVFASAHEVPLGTSLVFDAVFGKDLLVKNDDEIPIRCRVDVVPLKDGFVQAPPSYEPGPGLGCVRVSSRTLRVPPHGEAVLRGRLHIPNREAYRGKKYYWVLRVRSLDPRAPVEKYVRLFVETREAP
jgi:hypothetical protein